MANRYVRIGATGSNDGTDWTNAWSNTDQFAMGDLTRGDVIYLAEGNGYVGKTWNKAADGSTITIKKATVADHGTDTGWSDAFGKGQAIFTSGQSITTDDWVFDGQYRDNLRWGHGLKIEAKAAANNQKALRLDANIDNIQFRYVAFEGHAPGSTFTDNDAVYGISGSSNVVLSRCSLYEWGRVHFLTINGHSNWTIEHCWIFRNGNNFAETGQHSETWSHHSCDDFIFRFNVVEEYASTGGLMALNGDESQSSDRWLIYGNVFWHNPAVGTGNSSNGVIATGAASTNGWYKDAEIYNNAFVNIGGLDSGVDIVNGTGNLCRNNLWFNCSATSMTQNGTFSHNWYHNNVGQPTSETSQETGHQDPFVDWKNRDFRLKIPTRPGQSQAVQFARDRHGNSRSRWSRGALEYDERLLGRVIPVSPVASGSLSPRSV